MRYSIYYQFYEAVLRNPHNIALECAESTVTFIELYTKTIQAANVLRAEGVKKHDIVLLYMSNSIEYIIWMLAVLRMGAIVLPVDSTVPKQRTIEIIRESCPRIIICDDIINIQSVKWIGLQSYINEIATDENLPDQIDSLYSFCLYTSGSTGTSKGVLLKQEAICRHVKKKMELLQIDASSKMCTSFSISFVASIWILLAPLFTNAKLYIYNYDIYSNAHIFFNHVDTDAISIISVVPRFAGMYCKLIDNGHRKFNLSGLKYILLTGEKLDINIVHSFHSYYPKVNLVNAYGQTECSDDTFHFKIPYPFNNTDVPIGLPSEYIDTFILDTGELCLAGPCLFGRYLHEDFAHQAIIWIDECNKFMYKTGDIVTCRNDGLYYYIGRIDNQIKINGFRIYPEEIEREICAIPGINEAVIVPFENLNGVMLIAYYSSATEQSAWMIREQLSEKLPAYMIPPIYRYQKSLRKNNNGKIDRSFYRKLCTERISTSLPCINETKQMIAFTISLLSSVDYIVNSGISMSLAEVGLDSLAYIYLITELEDIYNIVIRDEIMRFYKEQSIDQLVDYIALEIRNANGEKNATNE